MGVNVAQMLHQGALRFPEREAVVDFSDGQRRSYDYLALDRAACRVAGQLRAAGVGPGARVALMAGNSARFVAAWFGAVYAGAAIVPIPVLSAAPEVAHRVGHPGAMVLLIDGDRRGVAEQAIAALSAAVPVLDVADLWAAAQGAVTQPVDTAAQDTAMVLYTSATTGAAKGAAISHAALMLHTAVMAFHTLRLGQDDVVMGVLPLTHSYGCRMVMLASLFVGARAVLFPRFDATVSLSAMAEEQVTWLAAVPTMFAAWGNLAEGEQPGQLRWALSAGAPLSEQIARRAEARLGAEVRQGFGMTEATFVSVNSPPDTRVFGSVGRPVWGIEVVVVDDAERRLGSGQDGQVLVRGHNMMTHYLDDPDATASALQDGWMHTGDIGHLDDSGRLYIVDRLKDLIIRGGNNVYPSEVEEALAGHPAVAEVAVVGRPDQYYGEEIVAVVVARGPMVAADLHAWTVERVGKAKVPREVAFVDSLPLGPSGKVLKRVLRTRLVAGDLATVAVGPPRPS